MLLDRRAQNFYDFAAVEIGGLTERLLYNVERAEQRIYPGRY